jgi:hypothetical protein
VSMLKTDGSTVVFMRAGSAVLAVGSAGLQAAESAATAAIAALLLVHTATVGMMMYGGRWIVVVLGERAHRAHVCTLKVSGSMPRVSCERENMCMRGRADAAAQPQQLYTADMPRTHAHERQCAAQSCCAHKKHAQECSSTRIYISARCNRLIDTVRGKLVRTVHMACIFRALCRHGRTHLACTPSIDRAKMCGQTGR